MTPLPADTNVTDIVKELNKIEEEREMDEAQAENQDLDASVSVIGGESGTSSWREDPAE